MIWLHDKLHKKVAVPRLAFVSSLNCTPESPSWRYQSCTRTSHSGLFKHANISKGALLEKYRIFNPNHFRLSCLDQHKKYVCTYNTPVSTSHQGNQQLQALVAMKIFRHRPGYVWVGCCFVVGRTIGTLDSIGHGHSIAGKILAAFGNPVSSCKHSGESPFQLS